MSFGTECDLMNSDCKSVFGVSVTFRRKTAGALNTTTMVRAVTTDADQSITAIRGPSEIVYDGSFRFEEVTYSILVGDITGGRPDAGDHIIDGTATRTGIRAATMVDEKEWKFTTRRKL